MFNRFAALLINGLLILGLAGLLLANLLLVSDLSSRVYRPDQREYLAYSLARSISQVAPTWNIINAEGVVEPAIFSGWRNRVRAALRARYEKQEGMNATVYDLDFLSDYYLTYPGPLSSTTIELIFPFPGNLDTLHGVQFLVDGEEPPEVQYTVQGIRWQTAFKAGEEHKISVRYQAEGANSFSYALHRDRRSDVDIQIAVLGINGNELDRHSLPPTGTEVDGSSETFTWNYDGLIANRDIKLALPTRLSIPQRVAQMQDEFRALAALAPILVGLFLASLAGLLHWGRVRLGPVAYLLIGWSLALFYLMLTFLSGRMGVIPATALAFLLISGLVLFFLGLVAGWRQTWWRAGWLLVIFLIILSLGILFPWGKPLLVCGGLLLLATFMLLYARRPVPPQLEPAPPSSSLPVEAPPEPVGRHCPHCGRALATDYGFCPGCGQDAQRFRACTGCGYEQFTSEDLAPIYCIHCGGSLA
jgi:hypothetical protein